MSGSSPQAPAAATGSRPHGVQIASTLCWLWGSLMALVSLALLVPAVAVHGVTLGPIVVPAVFMLLAAAYGYGGYALRRQRLVGGWLAGGAAACMAALQLRNGISRAAGVSLVVNVVIVGLVLANWRHLRSHAGDG